MGAPTGANGSCYIAPREFLMGTTRLLHMETPGELLPEALRGLRVGASNGASMELLQK